MGCIFVSAELPGELSKDEVRRQFEDWRVEDWSWNGFQYTGGWGMATGLLFPETHPQFNSSEEARTWLDQNAKKWEEALAVRVGNTWLLGANCSS